LSGFCSAGFKLVLRRFDREPFFPSWHTFPFLSPFEPTKCNEDSVSGTLTAAELSATPIIADESDDVSRLSETGA
jgi:hypothetical protein